MIDRRQLLELVVRPALASLPGVPGGDAACQLLMGTAAVESGFVYLHQLGGGPALGLWEMEGATHDDLWKNFLAFRLSLAAVVASPAVFNPLNHPPAERLISDLAYAAKMARIQYYRAPEPLPAVNDIAAMDALYLRRYNAGGASRPGEFTEMYGKLCAELFS